MGAGTGARRRRRRGGGDGPGRERRVTRQTAAARSPGPGSLKCPRSAGEGIKPNEYIHLLTDVYLTHKNVRFFFSPFLKDENRRGLVGTRKG